MRHSRDEILHYLRTGQGKMPRADGSPTIAEMFTSDDDYEESDMHLENVKFQKAGKDIIGSLNKRIEDRIGKSEEFKTKIAEVCKNRELDPKEVIDAGEDAEKVASYSNKMSSSMAPGGNFQSVPKGLVEALQADINNLRVWGSKVARLKTEITDYERVRNNIKEADSFVISYDELVQLGF